MSGERADDSYRKNGQRPGCKGGPARAALFEQGILGRISDSCSLNNNASDEFQVLWSEGLYGP